MIKLAFILKYCWLISIVDIACQHLDQSGREFVVVLPVVPQSLQQWDSKLYVNAPSDTLITVFEPGKVAQTFAAVGPASIEIVMSVQYTELAEVQLKGILIQTEADANVNVIRGELEGYMAIPKTIWSTDYVIVSYDTEGGHSYFTIAAFEDNTEVNVTFKRHFTGNCLALFGSTMSTTIVLQKQQVWGIYCDSGDDLTGSSIKSSRPVNVISGATIHGIGANVFMEEMLIPKAFHGKKFIFPSVNVLGGVWRVVASEDKTLVYGVGEAESYLDMGDHIEFSSDESNARCVQCTRPVQVMLLGKSSNSSTYSYDSYLGQPIMTTVPPIERFKNSYDIEIFNPSVTLSLTSYVVFIYETQYSTAMTEGLNWADTSATVSFYCCKYELFHLTDSLSKTFTVTRNYSFGVIQLGLDHVRQRGFGILSGMSFDDPYCPTQIGYETINDTICVNASTVPVTWNDAKAKCQTLGSRLIKLDTLDKMDAIKQQLGLLLDSQSLWIGLQQRMSSYQWTDGEEVGLQDWRVSQPDGSGKCVQLRSFNGHQGWDDAACYSMAGYVCERVLAETKDVTVFGASCTETPPYCPVASGYFYFHSGDFCVRPDFRSMTWTSANSACKSDGGRLVTVDSDDKLYHLYFLLNHIWKDFFIGGSWHNLANEKWVWTDCLPMTYSNWDVGQPEMNDRHCVAMFKNSAWQNVDCSIKKRFVCEIKSNDTQNTVTGPDDGNCAPYVSTSTMPASGASSSVDASPTPVVSSTLSFSSSSFISPSSVDATSTAGASTTAVDNNQPSSTLTQYSQTVTDTIIWLGSTSTASVDNNQQSSTSSASQYTVSISDSTTTWMSSPDQTDDTSSYSVQATTETIQASVTITGTVGHTSSDPLQTLGTSSDTSGVIYSMSTTAAPEWGTSSTTTITSNPAIASLDSSRTIHEACQCLCIDKDRLDGLQSDAVQRKQDQIRSELLLNKRNLTSYINKYISVKDNRPSSVSIGGLGIVMIAAPMVFFVMSDLLSLLL